MRDAMKRLLSGTAACFLFSSGALAETTHEFGGMCTMGLSERISSPTDCSVNWTAENGKTYCFGSEKRLEQFLRNPNYHLTRATDFDAMTGVEKRLNLMQGFSSKEVKAFVRDHVESAAAGNDGVFRLYDPVTRKELELVFKELNMMRSLHGYGFFPDLIFHATDNPEKEYWIDFWVRPTEAGTLEIVEERIYRGPAKRDGKWKQITRQPPPWWWIPASEHPGDTEHVRGWEVMSAIEEHVLQSSLDNGGTFKMLDEETGEEVELEYIAIHQPVRQLANDGKFFACSDFRKVGTEDEYYDVDFWLDDGSGEIRVGHSRVHKVPTLIDGNWIQIPRYEHDDLDYEVVP